MNVKKFKNIILYCFNVLVVYFDLYSVKYSVGRILNESLQKITKKAIRGKPFPADSIIIATTATIGEHALITTDFVANQRFVVLSKTENCKIPLNMKFVFYYCFLLGDWCRKNVNVSGFASIDIQRFKNFKIPLPPLEIQNEIVKVLDSFDKLVNDLTNGIPAEITARQKQYEYYREKLLTFKEKASKL